MSGQGARDPPFRQAADRFMPAPRRREPRGYRWRKGMKAASIRTHHVRVPFDIGAPLDDMGGIKFQTMAQNRSRERHLPSPRITF